MARNLIVCCDGTNNSLKGVKTNVALLSELADIGDESRQISYYDAGVGVEADPGMKTRVGGLFSKWFGSAFGTGLVANVEQAYVHLVNHYQPDDRIFLFGFSRGAYSARVIGGLLNNYGLLKKSEVARAPQVVKAYRDLFDDGPGPKRDARFDEARQIRDAYSLLARIHFMGLFDTVSSLGWAWDPKTFPNTRAMPNVDQLRHALALDERRAKFRTNRVKLTAGADHRQVWFAGVHSDVGGGYTPPMNRLSRIPLRWMLTQARAADMLVNPLVEQSLGLEATWREDEQAAQSESLDKLWTALEWMPLPHREETPAGWVEKKRVYGMKGWREMPDTFEAHASLQRRKVPVKNIHWAAAREKMTFLD